jgi:hypothetical protein
LLNTHPQHADEIANQGIDLLKQRYTFNNMTRIKFPAFTLFRTRMLLISCLHGFYVNGIQLQAYDPPLNFFLNVPFVLAHIKDPIAPGNLVLCH